MSYRLDKSFNKVQAFKEADDQSDFWDQQSIDERLKAAWFLTCQAYGLEYSIKHKLDRTVYSTRKQPLR